MSVQMCCSTAKHTFGLKFQLVVSPLLSWLSQLFKFDLILWWEDWSQTAAAMTQEKRFP